MTILTFHQTQVLHHMDGLNIGAILFEGKYQFPESFRKDAAMAKRYYDRNLSNDQDGSMDAENWLSDEEAAELTD